METARALANAQDNIEDITAYRAALRLNWRLWTIFQSDVSEAENPLPDDIKQNILSLSVFVDKHTVDALANPGSRKLKVLIDINRNIASGLMISPAADETPPAPTQPPSGGSNGGVVA
jgi:flagellar protein FlaF